MIKFQKYIDRVDSKLNVELNRDRYNSLILERPWIYVEIKI